MSSLAVRLTRSAERDLTAIYDFIAASDGEAAANRLLDRLLEVAKRLSQLPDRGSIPRELLALGIRDFRQVLFRPYRVIYRVVDRQVMIVLIAEGRRDMQTLLTERLMRAP